jgi:hypothetical protein
MEAGGRAAASVMQSPYQQLSAQITPFPHRKSAFEPGARAVMEREMRKCRR